MKSLGRQAMDGKVETLLPGVLESGPSYVAKAATGRTSAAAVIDAPMLTTLLSRANW